LLNTKYTCPCCGYKTFAREDHLWEICEVCYWQSCPVQNVEIYSIGGPNPMSLRTAQQNFMAIGACEADMLIHVRKPKNDEPKDENWKAIISENYRYFKRIHSETIQRFNKDWAAWEYYYFEVGDDNYACKQIQVSHLGRVLKYDLAQIEDQFGGLAEGALEIADEQYLEIPKEEFYELWNRKFTNEFEIKNLFFDENWNMAWYNLNLNTTEADLKKQELIICGTYRNTFLIEIGYRADGAYFFLQINESEANLTCTTTTVWSEMANVAQIWIDKIEHLGETAGSNQNSELIERNFNVRIDKEIYPAKFTMYQNMDFGIEKFRDASLTFEKSRFDLHKTYIGVENLLIEFQETLPPNMQMQNCFSCRYSTYNVAGNDNFGDLNCFKHCKEKIAKVSSKHEMIDLFESDYLGSFKVEETHYCAEYEEITNKIFLIK
jgi:Cysteine-rich CPCC